MSGQGLPRRTRPTGTGRAVLRLVGDSEDPHASATLVDSSATSYPVPVDSRWSMAICIRKPDDTPFLPGVTRVIRQRFADRMAVVAISDQLVTIFAHVESTDTESQRFACDSATSTAYLLGYPRSAIEQVALVSRLDEDGHREVIELVGPTVFGAGGH